MAHVSSLNSGTECAECRVSFQSISLHSLLASAKRIVFGAEKWQMGLLCVIHDYSPNYLSMRRILCANVPAKRQFVETDNPIGGASEWAMGIGRVRSSVTENVQLIIRYRKVI